MTRATCSLVAVILFGSALLSAGEALSLLHESGVKGGLVVHLGCGDGTRTLALRANESYLVQGLDADPANVEKARATVRAAGCYGPVSISRWTDQTYLPYTDNCVNLLIADELGGLSMDEVLRVLVPDGVALIGGKKTVKPRPADTDEWTHYMHEPDNNAVSRDREIDFLERLQWIGGPRYSRHHDHMSAASAMVSAKGRVFSIFDCASSFSIQLPSDWKVIARDAFNGTVLWTRDIDQWRTQMFRLKSGPASLPRRLVAVGDEVYVTLGIDAPVTALDAVTGQTLRTYEGTKGTEEILVSNGELYAVIDPAGPKPGEGDGPYDFAPAPRRIVALKLDTGAKRWEKDWRFVAPITLGLDAGHAAFFDGEKVVCLDRKDGSVLWQSEVVGNGKPMPSYFAPTLVLTAASILFSGGDAEPGSYHQDPGKTMYAFDLASGKTLWKAPHPPSGYRSPEDLFVINGMVWCEDTMNAKETRTAETGSVYGRDLKTGELKVEFMPDVETHWFHHRCYRARATEKYLLTSRTGIEFIDPATKHWTCHHWARGACLYGIMPANGMIYDPPNPCACYLESKLFGFNALAPKSPARQALVDAREKSDRLEKGPAYEEAVATGTASGSDWPMLRADAARSGCVATKVPADVDVSWRAKIGGRLSAPVVANGKLFVAAIDTHEIHALDAATGQPAWFFTAGARIDSPPAIWQGRVLFGSADGYVYSLRADDGRLIWRYRAAPADLRMGAFEQIESVWPVSGSVLVFDTPKGQPELWCVAGRSMFLDGGLRLLRLNPATGTKIDEKVLDDKVPDEKSNLQTVMKGLNMAVALPDVLLSDGRSVYMHSQQFDLDGNRVAIEMPTVGAKEQQGETAHLFCPTGLLDDIWWHRSYWVYGRNWTSGAGGYFQAGRFAPAGRPMVFDQQHVFAYGRKPQYYKWTTPMEYVLYACARQPKLDELGGAKKEAPNKAATKKKAGLGGAPPTTVSKEWTESVPVLARAMVLAQDTLFIAGPPALVDETETLKTFQTADTQDLLARQAAAFEGREGAVLQVIASADGRKIAERKLDALPIFDGLIAAGGRLYCATVDGQVLCLGGKQ